MSGPRIRTRRRPEAGRVAALAVIAGLLGGCAEGTLEDLRSYAARINQRPGGKIEPLPPIKPYNVYTYASAGERSPFESFIRDQPEDTETAEVESGVQPDFNRNREELEAFPLDSLRMVGTLQDEDELWAVVLAADATIHRVQVGNYLGQNHGKIVNIEENRIELVEIARDARGRWQERAASLALLEGE